MPRPITSLIHKFFKKCGKESICQCLVVPSKNELEPEDSDEDDINNNEIKMIACGAIIQGNFITNLKRHVQAKHPTEWNEFIEFSNEKTPQLPQSTRNHASQPLLTKHISVKKMSISINCSYESIEDAAVTMVTVDGRPFSCVEDTGFRKKINPMIAAMNMREKSNFTMHRKKVRDLVESYAEKMRNDITAVVQNRYVSLQIDCVTKNQRAFIGINAQLFINGKFILISLGVVELKEKHTSDYLKKVILNEVKRFGITEKFIYAVTTDNGANLVKCVKTLKSNNESTTPTTSTSTSNQNGNTTTNTTTTSHESEHDSSSYAMNDNQEFDFDYSVSVFEYSEAELSYSETPILCEDVESECLDLEHIWNSSATVCIRCGAHTLQLSVRDAVKDSGDTLPTINRAREVVKKLRTPRINMMLQKYTTIRPVLDVETRWMSSYDMIFRLLQIKTSVQQLSAIPDLALSEEEWVELESISKCLKAAKEATIELQRSDLTLTDLYGIWVECKLQTEKIDHPLAKSLVTALEARENMLMDNITFKSAMLLDPRYCFVLSKYDQIAASRHITDLYIEMKLTKKAPEMEKIRIQIQCPKNWFHLWYENLIVIHRTQMIQISAMPS